MVIFVNAYINIGSYNNKNCLDSSLIVWYLNLRVALLHSNWPWFYYNNTFRAHYRSEKFTFVKCFQNVLRKLYLILEYYLNVLIFLVKNVTKTSYVNVILLYYLNIIIKVY